MQTVLWGGPLDGQTLDVPNDKVTMDMVIPILTHYPPEYASDEPNFIRHHYVFDLASRRYNYAGDWP